MKGLTELEGKTALFPDAPTTRGVRHLRELMSSLNDGYRAIVLFIIMREEPMHFKPNIKIDKD